MTREDWYKPMDFFAKASSYAKRFCKDHPDADSETVFYAASEAAFVYEGTMKYRHIQFPRFVYAAIKNALYIRKRKEKKAMEETILPERTGKQRISDEVRAQIKAELAAGVKTKEICEKYKVSSSAVGRLRTEKKKPAPDKPKTSTNINNNTTSNIIPPENENVKSFGPNFQTIESTMITHLTGIVGIADEDILESVGSNIAGYSRIILRGRDGGKYVLEFRRENNG